MNSDTLLNVPPDDCVPGDWFNRTDLQLTDEFLADIKTHGVRQSLLVRPTTRQSKPHYEIIAGSRRHAAALKLKLATVPVRVEAMTDSAAREARLQENLHREGLTALDEAGQYWYALKTGDYGAGSAAVEALAARVGKSRALVYARLRLLKLNPAVRKAVAAGEIEQTVAELVATIPDAKQQEAALKRITNHHEWNMGKHVKLQMPYRDVKDLIETAFRKSLKDAPFDLKAENLAGEVSCAVCPLRTGNIEGLPAGGNANVCTAPVCYARKVAAYHDAALASLKAKGKTVLTGKDAPRWQYGSLAYDSGYVDAGGHHWVKGKQQPYTKLLGKQMPEILHAVKPNGHVVALCREKDIEAALVTAGVSIPEARANPAKSKAALEEERREEALRELEVTRIVEACMAVVENPKLTDRQHALFWAFVFRQLVTSKDEGALERMRSRHNVVADAFTRVAAIRPDADMLLEGVRGYAIECLILQDYESDYNEELLNELAKLCKVDTGAIAKAVRAEAAAREKEAVKSAPKPETRNPKPAKPAKVASKARK